MTSQPNSEPIAFRQGSIDAFEALYRFHQRAVYGWIVRLVRNPAVAEELTIEAFWRIYSARARFDPSRGFEGWARRIATNAALDWMRTHKAAEVDLAEVAEPAAPTSQDAALRTEMRIKIREAFNRLAPKLRAAAVLALIEEEPHKEIAAALGITVAAVKLRVYRATKLLRKDLERQGITP
jgi:RNA polymerase sigma-70 factor (ECF subfamily)